MNDRTFHTIDIEVTLKAPWLVQGNDPGRFGLDVTLMRDHNGNLVLPGSLILGRIRAAWGAMSDLSLDGIPKRPSQNPNDPTAGPKPAGDEWFGKEDDQSNTTRSRIWTDDLIAKADNTVEERLTSTRVAIDNETGAPEKGMLVMMEQTQKAGTTITFKGQWRVYLADDEVVALKTNLLAGLLWHTQLGAQRSVGFGELLSAKVAITEPVATNPPMNQGQQSRVKLVFDRPICVAASTSRGNVFVSGDIITGGTLKGAIASLIYAKYGQTVAERTTVSKLAEHFDAIRISHAFPSATGGRPCAIPMSLVMTKDEGEEKVWDVAALTEAKLIKNQAPAFLHDWKYSVFARANAARGWGETRDHLRVRTAIDEQTRKAKDEKLFAYQCKVAEEGVAWLADISLPEMPDTDRAIVCQELSDLLAHGLGPIGKTDAWASVEFCAASDNVWAQQEVATAAPVHLMLNTQALLFPSSAVADKRPDLFDLYKAAFDDISGNSLTLSHFYASQSMAGGNFLQKRFLKNKPYTPLVLTDAGSVFVLNIAPGKETDARNFIQAWQKDGLPLPDAVGNEHGRNWNHHPYIPENGFGEITVNAARGFSMPEANQLTAC